MRLIALWLMLAGLVGCSAPDAPPGSPGTATVSLHGRVEAGFGLNVR